eukprot:1648489-Pyramimonas_sp.AAC.1
MGGDVDAVFGALGGAPHGATRSARGVCRHGWGGRAWTPPLGPWVEHPMGAMKRVRGAPNLMGRPHENMATLAF